MGRKFVFVAAMILLPLLPQPPGASVPKILILEHFGDCC